MISNQVNECTIHLIPQDVTETDIIGAHVISAFLLGMGIIYGLFVCILLYRMYEDEISKILNFGFLSAVGIGTMIIPLYIMSWFFRYKGELLLFYFGLWGMAAGIVLGVWLGFVKGIRWFEGMEEKGRQERLAKLEKTNPSLYYKLVRQDAEFKKLEVEYSDSQIIDTPTKLSPEIAKIINPTPKDKIQAILEEGTQLVSSLAEWLSISEEEVRKIAMIPIEYHMKGDVYKIPTFFIHQEKDSEYLVNHHFMEQKLTDYLKKHKEAPEKVWKSIILPGNGPPSLDPEAVVDYFITFQKIPADWKGTTLVHRRNIARIYKLLTVIGLILGIMASLGYLFGVA